MSYDELYRELPAAFGVDPDPLLVRFAGQIPSGRPLLDIGAGQGRHALFLARQGYEVEALEPSGVGAAALTESAAGEGLSLQVEIAGFEDLEDLDGLEGGYGAAMAFGLVPDLGRPQVEALCQRMRAWTATGGLLFLTGFTTDDPAYERFRSEWTEVGRHSFAAPEGSRARLDSPEGCVRTYLEPGEVVGLLPGLELLHHWEGLGPEHRHGDGPPERHGRFEFVGRVG